MAVLYSAGPIGNSLKVLIAAAEKGLSLDHRPVDALTLAQYDAAFHALNPSGGLPVLVDGDVVLTESSIINEYLDEAKDGPPLMPTVAEDRWRAHMWFKFVNEDLAPAVAILAWSEWTLPGLSAARCALLTERVAALEVPERRHHWQLAMKGFEASQRETSEAKIEAMLDLVEARLIEGPWLAGNALSLADIDVWPFLMPLPHLRPALLRQRPRTRAWIDCVASRPAVRTASAGYANDLWVPGPELIRWG